MPIRRKMAMVMRSSPFHSAQVTEVPLLTDFLDILIKILPQLRTTRTTSRRRAGPFAVGREDRPTTFSRIRRRLCFGFGGFEIIDRRQVWKLRLPRQFGNRRSGNRRRLRRCGSFLRHRTDAIFRLPVNIPQRSRHPVRLYQHNKTVCSRGVRLLRKKNPVPRERADNQGWASSAPVKASFFCFLRPGYVSC